MCTSEHISAGMLTSSRARRWPRRHPRTALRRSDFWSHDILVAAPPRGNWIPIGEMLGSRIIARRCAMRFFTNSHARGLSLVALAHLTMSAFSTPVRQRSPQLVEQGIRSDKRIGLGRLESMGTVRDCIAIPPWSRSGNPRGSSC